MSLGGVVLLFLVGKLVYNARFDGNILGVLAGFTICALSFFAFGYLIASLSPTARTAQISGMIIAFPLMFLSGAAIPLEVLPEKVTSVSKYLPLYHVVTFMRGLWAGDSWADHWIEIIVLMGLLVVGTAVSVKTFRWE